MRRRYIEKEKEPLLESVRTSTSGTWIRNQEDGDTSLLEREEDTPQQATTTTKPTILSIFWSIITDFIRNLRNVFQTLPQIAATQTSPLATSQQANALKAVACAPFDPQRNEDLECLKSLWKTCFPEENLPANLESDLWKKIGFQSNDPIRDIRGTGTFGVNNLLFFAEKYPRKFRRLIGLDERTNSESEKYPFIVGGFNVTMMLFELLGWGWKTAGKSTAKNSATHDKLCSLLFDNTMELRDSIFVFNELFCVATQLLDDTWTEMHAQYMDFPKVIVGTQAKFEQALLTFHRTADISTWNSEH